MRSADYLHATVYADALGARRIPDPTTASLVDHLENHRVRDADGSFDGRRVVLDEALEGYRHGQRDSICKLNESRGRRQGGEVRLAQTPSMSEVCSTRESGGCPDRLPGM